MLRRREFGETDISFSGASMHRRLREGAPSKKFVNALYRSTTVWTSGRCGTTRRKSSAFSAVSTLIWSNCDNLRGLLRSPHQPSPHTISFARAACRSENAITRDIYAPDRPSPLRYEAHQRADEFDGGEAIPGHFVPGAGVSEVFDAV
jgi:hypothetical protein